MIRVFLLDIHEHRQQQNQFWCQAGLYFLRGHAAVAVPSAEVRAAVQPASGEHGSKFTCVQIRMASLRNYIARRRIAAILRAAFLLANLLENTEIRQPLEMDGFGLQNLDLPGHQSFLS
jgi:hypothetical protein